MPKIKLRVKRTDTTPTDATIPGEVSEDGSFLTPGKILAAGALVGAGVLARKPGLIGKGLSHANTARQQVMLSGMAVPKSILGNTGAAIIESAERKSMGPIKEFFSKRTLQDARAAYKANVPYPGTTQLPGPLPGRIMGAMDTATRNALQRGGLTAKEAERAVLQAPLNGELGEALDSPMARYLIPFRRTPFNQFTEGLKTLKAEHPVVLGATSAAGAAHGAATADERYPLNVGLGVAAAGRYGLPYSLAALLGRSLAGGRTDAGLAGAVLPVSEYGLTTGMENPLQPFRRPAALTALERMTGTDIPDLF